MFISNEQGKSLHVFSYFEGYFQLSCGGLSSLQDTRGYAERAPVSALKGEVEYIVQETKLNVKLVCSLP